MKIRFIEPIKNDPRIQIMPDCGEFDSFDAVIEVSFFDWLEHDKIYRPLVRPNISFGNRMNPEDALQWAKCFEASYQVANRIIPESIGMEQSREIRMCWIIVDEIASEMKK